MVADEVAWLGAKGRELLTDYARERPQQRLRTFAEVEELWETVVRPRFREFQTMQYSWGDRGAVPPDSPWARNAAILDRG
jgi:creatinine amidohydrolase